MSCGTTAMASPQAFLRHARDVLSVDQDAAALQVVEALQQREQRRLAAARPADQADALARFERQVEVRRKPGARPDSGTRHSRKRRWRRA